MSRSSKNQLVTNLFHPIVYYKANDPGLLGQYPKLSNLFFQLLFYMFNDGKFFLTMVNLSQTHTVRLGFRRRLGAAMPPFQ